MRRILLTVLTIGTANATTPNYITPTIDNPLPGNRVVITAPRYGCPSLDDWSAIGKAQAINDKIGAEQASQACRPIGMGSTALITDQSVWHGSYQMRLDSDPESLWWVNSGVGQDSIAVILPKQAWYSDDALAGKVCSTSDHDGEVDPVSDYVASKSAMGFAAVQKISDTETDVVYGKSDSEMRSANQGRDRWFTSAEACRNWQKTDPNSAQNVLESALKPDGKPPVTAGPALAASLVGKHVFDYGGAPLCHDKAGVLDWWKTGNDGSGPDYPAPKGCIIPADGGVVGIIDRAEGGFVHLTHVHETDEHNKTVPIGLGDGTTARGNWTAGWSVFRDRKNTTVLHPLGNGKYGPATDDGPPDQLWCRDDNSKCNGA
jgi:hypothetical protein